MNILHLLTAGNIGGIESLCKDIAKYSEEENTFAFIFQEGIIYQEMLDSGYDVHSYRSAKFSRKTLLSLKKLCLDNQIQIIQVHHRDMFLYWFAIQLSKKLMDVKLITTIHSCYPKEGDYPRRRVIAYHMMNHFIRKMVRTSDYIVSVSKAGSESFQAFDQKLMDRKPTAIVYNGIDEDLLKSGQEWEWKWDSSDIRLLYIGRIEEIKGVQNLIKAVDKLKKQIPIHLKIVGTGSKLQEYKELVHQMGCDAAIEFTGPVRGDALIDLRRDSAVFIYPSVCPEIFGLSVIEAMAFGLIPVVTPVGGLPEIVDDTCAVIAKDCDAKELEIALNTLLREMKPEQLKRMSDNAKLRARQFSISNTIRGLSSVYEALVNGKQEKNKISSSTHPLT